MLRKESLLPALVITMAILVFLCGCESNSADAVPPADVAGLAATAGDGLVRLAWTDPADADLAWIEVSVPTDSASVLAVQKNAGTATMAGLANGTAYTFTVKAVDTSLNRSVGVSQSATPVSGADVTAPADVTSLAAAAGNGSVTLSWTDPTDADLSYVEAAVTGMAGVRIVAEAGTGTAVMGGLVNGTTYTFTVKAVDASGNQSVGVSRNATPASGADVTAPADVTGLAVTAVDGTATLVWNDPADADFDHVTVSVSGIGGSSIVVEAGMNTVTVPGLSNGTAYTLTVKAVDASGNASTGLQEDATPQPSGDVVPPAEVTGLAAAAGNGQVRLTWTDPADGDLAYVRITHTQAGGTVPYSAPQGVQEALLEGLVNGVPTTFSVESVDEVGNVSAGVTVDATASTSADPVAPGPVTGLSAMCGDRVVLLSWSDPSDSDLNHVRIVYDPGSGQARLNAAPGGGNARITDLVNGTAFTFHLCAVDDSGNLSAAASIEATPTTTGDMSAPGDVSGIVAVALDGGVYLEWVDPSDADLNHIEITHGGTGGSVPVFVGKDAQSARILGLSNETAYAFTVKTSDASLNLSAGVEALATPTNVKGGVVVGVTLDTPTNTPILFSGIVVELLKPYNDGMTVISSESDASSYEWYLDGEVLSTGSNTVVIASGTLALSRHAVTLVIVKGGKMYSGRFTFLVVNN